MSKKLYKAALKMISDRVQQQPSTKPDDYITPGTDLHDLFYDGFNAGQVVANNACAKIAKEALEATNPIEYGDSVIISNLVQVIDPHTGEYLWFPK